VRVDAETVVFRRRREEVALHKEGDIVGVDGLRPAEEGKVVCVVNKEARGFSWFEVSVGRVGARERDG
jgi:hydrogenase maturation factor